MDEVDPVIKSFIGQARLCLSYIKNKLLLIDKVYYLFAISIHKLVFYISVLVRGT